MSLNQTYLFTLLILPSLVLTGCYYADEHTLADDEACNTTAIDTGTFCCADGWSCLSNGLCRNDTGGNEGYSRGSCTDRSWRSPQCPPSVCLDLGSKERGAAALTKCDVPGRPDLDYYYCADSTDITPVDCGAYTNDERVVVRNKVLPSAITTIGVTPSSGQQSSSTSIPTSPTPFSTTTVTSLDSTSKPTPPPSVRPTSNHSTAIGAGVGVPVGIAAFGLVVYLLVRKKISHKEAEPLILEKGMTGQETFEKSELADNERVLAEMSSDRKAELSVGIEETERDTTVHEMDATAMIGDRCTQE